MSFGSGAEQGQVMLWGESGPLDDVFGVGLGSTT